MFKRFAFALSASILVAGAAQAGDITGAGATFPAPIYLKWADAYKKATGASLNYQAIGSGGGIKQIKAKTVDFGASDKPLKPEDLNAAGLYQFPTVIGGVVPIVNLPGYQPGQIKISGELLAEIYMGAIKNWNDPKLVVLNRGLKLPNLPITVVHRADGSGTSFIYTSYLSAKSPAWSSKVGASDSVAWPAGVGGKGNDGVDALVKQTVGSIGYVEYVYARKNHNTFMLVQNHSGAFPTPNAAAFAAAAGGANWAKAPGNFLLLIDQAGPKAWPISGATFILVYKQQADANKGADVLKFFDWAYKNGDADANALYYVPLPLSVKYLMRKEWASNVMAGGKPVYVSK
jgi:phosphate transport system substrate-binding protein